MVSVYIETYGCAFNTSDSEAMAGLLRDNGYELSREEALADVVVLNTCTVKDRTYLDFRKRLEAFKRHRLSNSGPAVVVAGCVPKTNQDEPLLQGVVQVGTNNISDIVQAVDAALAGEVFLRVEARREERIALRGIRQNPAIEILPINQGCLSACSFCQTRIARGRLSSFPVREIVSRARQALTEGVSELWLTSQDTGAFGMDTGSSLPELLEALVSLDADSADYRIRLGMSSPQWIRRDLRALIDVYSSPHLYEFLHIPVQSGDDRVLDAMKRGHTVADYEEACAAFRETYPKIAIWTDIIAGFPTETDEEFEHSLQLIRRTHPATVNRSRFSPRPGTAAANLPQLPSSVISHRSRRLNGVAEWASAKELSQWLDWEGEVRVSEKKKAGSVVARNDSYRPVILQGDFEPGQKLRVRILSHTTYHLNGQVIG